MRVKKDEVYSLILTLTLLIGLFFVVSWQPAVETTKNLENRAGITTNIVRNEPQNGGKVASNEFRGSQQAVFVESAELLAEEMGQIDALENTNLENSDGDFVADDRYKDVGQKLLPFRDYVSLDSLTNALKGFGDFFTRPYGELIDPNSVFSARDKDVVQKTKEAFRNPASFALGQQCGLSGAAFSYPPGEDVGFTACGGTPGYGGTSCNTSPQCYFSGRCFWVCTSSGCSCRVPSCYGKCGDGSAYIWDSVTHKCGCGT